MPAFVPARALLPWLVLFPAVLSPTPAAAQGTVFKGVFEPVPFPADIALNDVFFVTPEVGWATGGNGLSNGVIIGTSDGGANWTVQVGDPESSERPYTQLRFVDGKLGFAAQSAPGTEHRLLRTKDGEGWTVVGTVPEHRTDYAFVSATVGVTATSEVIRRTTDAGRTWKEAFVCRIKVRADGLTRDARCYIEAFHFPTRRVGYGIGYSPDAPGVYFAKTEDSGATWSAWMTLPEERGHEAHLFFMDEQRGSACLTGGKFVTTDDGGQTWSAVPGPACDGKPAVRFADPEVGWTAVYSSVNFTVNGGRSWSGRTVKFPALINAFSLPRRDRAFVVGDHGMIYRYRVVPANEPMPADAIAGPAMPVITDAVDEHVSELEEMIDELEEAVNAAPDSVPADSAAGEEMAPVEEWAPYEPATFDPSYDDFPLPSPDFPAPSDFTSACCGEPENRFRVLLGALLGALPQLLEKHRNTNTLGGTLLMLVELPFQVTGVREAAAAFWGAPDKASALQALTDLRAAAGELQASTEMAFQRQPAEYHGFDAPGADEGASMVPSAGDADARESSEAGGTAVDAAKKAAGGLIKKRVSIPR